MLLVAMSLALASPAEAGMDACARCDVPIGDNPYVLDAFGNKRHLDHERDAWGRKLSPDDWPCHYCGRAVARPGRQGACATCARTAVDRQEAIAASAKRITAWMARMKLRFPHGPPPIRLVDADEIDDRHFLAGNDGLAHVSRLPRLLWFDEPRTAPLYVRSGLPRIRFEAVVAHELMHAWSWLDGQPPHRPMLREGAAELLGTRWLSHVGTPEARFYARAIARNSDFRYGGGLRRAQAFVARNGVEGLVRLMRTSLDFPPGY